MGDGSAHGEASQSRGHACAAPGRRAQVTISNHEGDTLHQNTLKQVPGDVQFATWRKGDAPGDSKDTTMSVVLGGRSLLLYDVAALDRTPVELAFQAMSLSA